jgi:hypothetical protein
MREGRPLEGACSEIFTSFGLLACFSRLGILPLLVSSSSPLSVNGSEQICLFLEWALLIDSMAPHLQTLVDSLSSGFGVSGCGSWDVPEVLLELLLDSQTL